MNNKDTVEISLPRHVACWLLVQCDRRLAQLSLFLSRCDSEDNVEWALAEMKLYNHVYGLLNLRLSERDILEFLDRK